MKFIQGAAPNPILGSRWFIPDVEAHQWEDGRVYLYGSCDVCGKMDYCSDQYHVFSSADMKTWKDHGVVFSLGDVSWAEGVTALYAPDCAYRNGTYYLYYCIPDGRCGVATSRSPVGPFVDQGPMEGVTMIDPAVLIDDDGTAYLYWGQFDGVRVAKLQDDMLQIIPESVRQPLSVAEHEFHEGSSVKKINGRYYYLFTDTHRHGNRATSLGYAVSDHPDRDFRYGGVIIDNFGCDPDTWNNHGSMFCYQEQWYIFYHRSTHNSYYSRWVCVEPIEILPDGSIPEVKMTASGIGDALPACEWLPAWRACELRGNARIASDEKTADGMALTGIQPGDAALFRGLCWKGEDRLLVNIRGEGGIRIELWQDGWYQTSLQAELRPDYAQIMAEMPALSGGKEMELRFYGRFTEAAVASFRFTKR